ncbi:hypothetical protein F5148DRAFT_1264464 [Russula earlei]|uniref:Uncharacterized protein n=1 Tax=Russula earlei TaxID=71964 RepID=A0ACC0TSL3_9AGAM|nr:hypothetical protein F5148DRAFT_1264464 [Russula earlei]
MISMRTLSGFVIFILAVGNPPSLALPSTRAVLSTRGKPPGKVIHTTPNKHGSGDQTHLSDDFKKQPDRWLKEKERVPKDSAQPAPKREKDRDLVQYVVVGKPRHESMPSKTVWTETTPEERMHQGGGGTKIPDVW